MTGGIPLVDTLTFTCIIHNYLCKMLALANILKNSYLLLNYLRQIFLHPNYCFQSTHLHSITSLPSGGKRRKSRSARNGLVSLNRLSVGCGTTPRRQSGDICRLLFGIRVIYTILPPHGHCRNIYFINNCKFVYVFILC